MEDFLADCVPIAIMLLGILACGGIAVVGVFGAYSRNDTAVFFFHNIARYSLSNMPLPLVGSNLSQN